VKIQIKSQSYPSMISPRDDTWIRAVTTFKQPLQRDRADRRGTGFEIMGTPEKRSANPKHTLVRVSHQNFAVPSGSHKSV